MKIVFLILTLSAALSAAETFSDSKIHEVSQSRYWKLLLHYRNLAFFGDTSEVFGAVFFLSSEGRSNPEAELRADIKAFSDPMAEGIGNLKQHPQCAFPERYRFLKKEIGFKSTDQTCKDFTEWKMRFDPESITLIYAAPYLGSPASMFGHSFLRIDSRARKGHGTKNDLLDYGISFEAVMGETRDIAYPIKGLLGFYDSVFSQSPYYQKINTYVNMESRDLWEYQVNLGNEQISRLLNHLWEMGMAHFNYYFFSRNCAYHLLSLLEVANPEWHLREKFGPMAIPIDTIRAVLSESNSVKSIHFRPSLLAVIKKRVSLMSNEDEDRFLSERNHISEIKSEDSVEVLDALVDWEKYKAMSGSLTIEEAEKKIDQNLLILRARAPESTEPTTEIPVRPDQGHPSTKVSAITGTESGYGTYGLELRPAFHDLLDQDAGYLPDSALVIARIRASYLNKFRLDDFTFAEVTSFEPLTRLQKPLSWTVSGGITRPVDTACVDCIAGYAQGGVGLDIKFINGFSLVGLITAHAEILNQAYRVGPGAMIMANVLVSKKLKALGSFEYVRYFLSNQFTSMTKTEAAIAYTLSPFEFRIQADFYNSPNSTNNLITFNTGYYY